MPKVKVKICGVKTLEAVQVAAQSGASFVGLVFYPPSPRYLTLETAREILSVLQQLPDAPKSVGLFVNVSVAEMVETAEKCALAYLQLAGDETVELCRAVAKVHPVIKSIRLKPPLTLDEALTAVAPYAELENVTVLLDAYKSGFYGGTGERGDWEIAREIARRWRLILAGGLTPENVAQAVTAVQPWGVDVSSGVEKDDQPGIKDLEKIRKFAKHALSVQNKINHSTF
ncbi:MAG: phosphoribosylanthranilate isomerase [Chloroflexi bacterium]|uniref:N-(5'-phosphoribosyl)anthranilate isomerase n=1 Tax=Candidatus Chlorohelix allophototropha TaxID=3003348 RepID=A0A8T7M2A9_9CHLR|nr:phosphoribosylanthranilate isomerase [Chloroflexota bacterium]WJW67025.1 phosphoribosylanthranilate isomerase [Chloroflexota bacterium L227-S17]